MTSRPARFTALVGETTHRVEVRRLGDGRFEIAIDDRTRIVDSRPTGQVTLSLLIEHTAREVSVLARGDTYTVDVGVRPVRVRLLDERAMRARGRGGADSSQRELRSIMPGKVVTVLVEVGATVEAGQGILVIEAMKMENEIAAPRSGTVQELKVQPGQAVEAGELLAVIE